MAETTRTILSRTLTPQVATAVVRAGAGWIALGGVMKLFWGSPFDLPEVLHGLMSSNPAGFLALVIGIELFVATLALASPRLGWWCVAGLLAVFTIIAGIETVRGAEACGCFGGAVAVPPWLVAMLDLVFLAGVMAVQPWQLLKSAPWRIWSVGPALGGFVVALLVIGEESSFTPADATPNGASDRAASNTPIEIVPRDNGVEDESPSIPGGGTTSDGNSALPGNSGTQSAPPTEGTWRLPERMPRFVVLQPNRWIGQSLAQTDLATWADVSKFPADATLIFYMDTCPHCRDLLSDKAMLLSPPTFVLIRIPAPPNLPIYVKDEVPAGMRVDLPRGTRWNIQVPWEVVVSGGIVESAEYHGH